MLGIECKWECPSCGNIINTDLPIIETKVKLPQPKKCGCGRKSSFNLLSFKQCEFKKEQEKE